MTKCHQAIYRPILARLSMASERYTLLGCAVRCRAVPPEVPKCQQPGTLCGEHGSRYAQSKSDLALNLHRSGRTIRPLVGATPRCEFHADFHGYKGTGNNKEKSLDLYFFIPTSPITTKDEPRMVVPHSLFPCCLHRT